MMQWVERYVVDRGSVRKWLWEICVRKGESLSTGTLDW
jgi:hypothetical protein